MHPVNQSAASSASTEPRFTPSPSFNPAAFVFSPDSKSDSSTLEGRIEVITLDRFTRDCVIKKSDQMIDDINLDQKLHSLISLQQDPAHFKESRQKILSFLYKKNMGNALTTFLESNPHFPFADHFMYDISDEEGYDLLFVECLTSDTIESRNLPLKFYEEVFEKNTEIAKNWLRYPVFQKKIINRMLKEFNGLAFFDPEKINSLFDLFQKSPSFIVAFTKNRLINQYHNSKNLDAHASKSDAKLFLENIEKASNLNKDEVLRFAVYRNQSDIAQKLLSTQNFSLQILQELLAETTQLDLRLLLEKQLSSCTLLQDDALSASGNEEFCDICTRIAPGSFLQLEALQHAVNMGYCTSTQYLLTTTEFSLEQLKSIATSRLASLNSLIQQQIELKSHLLEQAAIALLDEAVCQHDERLFKETIGYILSDMHSKPEMYHTLGLALENGFKPYIEWSKSHLDFKTHVICFLEKTIESHNVDIFQKTITCCWDEQLFEFDEFYELFLLAVSNGFFPMFLWGLYELKLERDHFLEVLDAICESKSLDFFRPFFEKYPASNSELSEIFEKKLEEKDFAVCRALSEFISDIEISPEQLFYFSSKPNIDKLTCIVDSLNVDLDVFKTLVKNCIAHENREGLDILSYYACEQDFKEIFESNRDDHLDFFSDIFTGLIEKNLIEYNDPIFNWCLLPGEILAHLTAKFIKERNYVFLAFLYSIIGDSYGPTIKSFLPASSSEQLKEGFAATIRNMAQNNLWVFDRDHVSKDPLFYIKALSNSTIQPSRYVYNNEPGIGDGVKKQFFTELLSGCYAKLNAKLPADNFGCLGKLLSIMFAERIPTGELFSTGFYEDLLFVKKTPTINDYLEHRLKKKQEQNFEQRKILYDYLVTNDSSLLENVCRIIEKNATLLPLVIERKPLEDRTIFQYLSSAMASEGLVLDFEKLEPAYQMKLQPLIDQMISIGCYDSFDELKQTFTDPIRGRADMQFPYLLAISRQCSESFFNAIEKKEFESIMGITLKPGINLPFAYSNASGEILTLDSSQLDDEDRIILEKIQWIQERVEEKLSTNQQEWVKKLLFFITSSTGFFANSAIGVRKGLAGKLPQAQTCFKLLYLSADRQERSVFLERLDLALQSTTFDFA